MRSLLAFCLLVISSFGLCQQKTKEAVRASLQEIELASGAGKFEKITSFLETQFQRENREAFQLLKQANLLIEFSSDTTRILDYFYYAGLTYRYHGNLDDATSAFEKGLIQAQHAKDTSRMVDFYNQIVKVCIAKGAFDQARSYNSSALKLAKECNYIEGIVSAKNQLAISYLMQGDYLKTLEIYDGYLGQCPDSILSCWAAKGQQAVALNRTGKPAQAIEVLLQISEHYEEQGNTLSKAYTDHHIGYMLDGIGLHVQALEFYLEVRGYFQEYYNKEQLIHLNKNIGALFLKLGVVDSATTYLTMALELMDEDNYEDVRSELVAYFGQIKAVKGDFDAARDLFRKAMFLNNKAEDKLGLAENNLFLATLFYKAELLDSSLYFLKRASTLTHAYKLLQEKMKVMDLFISIFEKKGLSSKADSTRKVRTLLEKELLWEQNRKRIDKAIILTKLSKSKNDAPADISQTTGYKLIYIDWQWAIVAFVSFSVLLLVLFLRNRVRKREKATLSRLKENESSRIQEELNSQMRDFKLYLDPDLSLSKLANLICTSDKNLSHFLNQHLETSFYDYLNKSRIEEFLQKVNTEKYHNYTLTGVALECGFKSKSNFYRAFKKEKQMSPKEYLAMYA